MVLNGKITKISKGSISQKSDGKYIVQITITMDSNRKKRISKVADNKRSADELLRKTKQNLLLKMQEQTLHIEETKKRIKDNDADIYVNYLLNEWLIEKEQVEQCAAVTLYTNKLIINNNIKRFFGKKLIQDITPEDLTRLYGGLCRKYQADSVHKIAGIISNSFRILCRNRRVPYNPTDGIRLPRITIIEKQPLTQDEINLLLSATDMYDDQHTTLVHNMPTFIRLALATGCRRGELCALKWSDIDFVNKQIHVRHAVSEVQGKMIYKGTKTNKERTISVSSECIKILQEHRKNYATGNYVFRSKWDVNKPQSPTSVRHSFDRIKEMTGIDRLTLHLLRHTSISILAQHNVDIRTIAQRAGHSDIQTTMRYMHSNSALDRQAADVLDKII